MTTEPTTVEEHKSVVEPLRAQANALPVDAVREPDVPIDTFQAELSSALAAARENQAALESVGLEPEELAELEALARGLRSAQSLWNTEQRKGRSNETQLEIDQLTEARQDALDAADLALRKNRAGQERLTAIRAGEGLADLVQDGFDLGTLLTDAAPLFAAIKFDALAAARQLTTLANSVQTHVAGEEAAKTLSGSKDLRDRIYTLTLEPLSDLRAYAAYAFRKDRNNTRRHAFSSAYARRRRKKAGKDPVG